MRCLPLLLLLAAPALGQSTPDPKGQDVVVLRDAANEPRWKLVRRRDGYVVKDGKGARRYRLKLDARRVKVRDAKGRDVAYANTDGRKLKVKHPTTKATRFKLQPRPAGGYKLETAQDVTVARLKSDGKGGWTVTGKKRAALGRVEARKGGGWTVRGPKGAVRLTAPKGLRALALACLLLPDLSQAERLGLLALAQHMKRP